MKHTHTLSRISLVTILACAYLLSCMAGPANAGSVAPPENILPCPVEHGQGTAGRALILIQGLFSRGTSERMWEHMIAALADVYGGFVYFSYSGRAHDYTISDTWESISKHDVPLLYDLISSCQKQGWTSFDIMGHSKGGVVATEYIKAHGLTGSQAGLARHIITLDAPVNGSELAWLLVHGPAHEVPAPWWNIDPNVATGVVELAQMFEERESVQQSNKEAALRLQQNGRCLLTVTNDQDVAISRADAIVAGFGRSYDLGIVLTSDTGRRLGHHRTLDVPNDTSELEDIRNCLICSPGDDRCRTTSVASPCPAWANRCSTS